MKRNSQLEQSNILIFLGLVLFLLGLVVGLLVQSMANPRMALSAHLEGLMNGMFLMILGLIWPRVALSRVWLSATFVLVVYGTFANLSAVFLAAATKSGKMMPLAGGQEGSVLSEILISFLLISLTLSMLTVCILTIVGFYNHLKHPESESER